MENLNSIDQMTPDEIVGGDTGSDIDHDGVELSIHGSEDEFGDDGDETEPGEIPPSEEEAATPAVNLNNNKSTKLEKLKQWRQDPDFKEFLNEILDERDGTNSGKGRKGMNPNLLRNENEGLSNNVVRNHTESYSKSSPKAMVARAVAPAIKSPSDTTIYSPGLRKASNDITLIDKISNFVESIRLDNNRTSDQNSARSQHNRRQAGDVSHRTPLSRSPMLNDVRRVEHARPSTSGPNNGRYLSNNKSPGASGGTEYDSPSNARDPDRVADQLVVQAEKFKAKIEAPKGNFANFLMTYDHDQMRSKFIRPDGLAPIDSEIMFLRNFDQDDEFFHITSQIDPTLRAKIERGEYIDLERLLPKERSAGRFGNEDLNKQLYQLITQGTNGQLEPPFQRNGKINNVRRWDQAFRVFAAIYTQANPNRSSEIWQYVYIIHTAASANPWENVYFYDVNFRELMASKPWRSWGKTYTQGWNMAFNNNSSGYHNYSNGYHNQNQGFNGNGSNKSVAQSSSKNWKDDCCWRFNSNKCKKSGKECDYDHRCKFCAMWNHGYHNCRKRLGKNKKNSMGNSTSSSVSNTGPSNSPKKEN